MDSTLTQRQRQGRTFGAAADDYERGRPDWPPAVLDMVMDGLGLTPASTVLDVAAGTGKLTRLLAARFTRTIAVEPLEPMRRVLAAEVPGVEVRDGTAEQLPVGEAEVDAIFVAEAFHWFDGAQALAEAARVLRPGGGIALLWNRPAGPLEPALPESARRAIRAAVAAGGEPGGDYTRDARWREPFAGSVFDTLVHAEVGHELVRDHEGLVANVMSISSIAGLPAADRQALRARLTALIPPGTYRQPLRAEVFWARTTVPRWCDRCGEPARHGNHAACVAARELEPPRFCPHCRRRMKVQVLPVGWVAVCVMHGETRHS